MANDTDKRKHPRFDSQNLSFFTVNEADQIVGQGMGRTLNLSESGILLETRDELANNQQLDMEFAMQDIIVHARGQVVHVQKNEDHNYHVGIEFTMITDEDMETLKHHLG